MKKTTMMVTTILSLTMLGACSQTMDNKADMTDKKEMMSEDMSMDKMTDKEMMSEDMSMMDMKDKEMMSKDK